MSTKGVITKNSKNNPIGSRLIAKEILRLKFIEMQKRIKEKNDRPS